MKTAELLDFLATTVLLLDRNGVVVRTNAACEDFFGRSRRQIEGQQASTLFEHDPALSQTLQDACAGSLVSVRQTVKMYRNGALCECSVMTSSVNHPSWAAVMEMTDQEQRLTADRTQRLADEISAQRELLRNLAHEVKNPLGGLRGAAQLLESELPDVRLMEYTQVIISEADRLQSLVDRLTTPTNTPLHKSPTNIHEICERVAMLISAEFPDITLERDYDASMPDVVADASRLVQALLNVVRNAAQILNQTPILKQPVVFIKTRVARHVVLHHKQYRLAAQISVIDNGPGVSDLVRERIFHPLVTDRHGGTGLGLSLAQDYLLQHNGMIEFESTPGRTEFKLLIPLELL